MVHRGGQQLRSCAHGDPSKPCFDDGDDGDDWAKLESNGVALGSKRVQGRKNSNENHPFFPLFTRWSPAKYYYVLEVGVSLGQPYIFSPYSKGPSKKRSLLKTSLLKTFGIWPTHVSL